MAPLALRETAWARLAAELPRAALEAITQEIGLDEAIPQAQRLMEGKVRGRLVVHIAG